MGETLRRQACIRNPQGAPRSQCRSERDGDALERYKHCPLILSQYGEAIQPRFPVIPAVLGWRKRGTPLKRQLSNDPRVFADCRLRAVKTALLRRLDAAGYFSVSGTQSRELEAECYSIMTVKQCRDHVEKVERLAAQYRRTPPLNMKDAANGGFVIDEMTTQHYGVGLAMTKGLARIQEDSGLRRKFVVPFTAHYSWGRPRPLAKERT